VGLNFGPAVVGDIGQREAVTPAVIGATVNLAARLEKATRELGSDAVMSEQFANRLHSEVPVAAPTLLARYGQTQTIQVKGFSEPVRVFFNNC